MTTTTSTTHRIVPLTTARPAHPATVSGARAAALALTLAAAALAGCQTAPPDYQQTGEYGVERWALPGDGAPDEHRWMDGVVAFQRQAAFERQVIQQVRAERAQRELVASLYEGFEPVGPGALRPRFEVELAGR